MMMEAQSPDQPVVPTSDQDDLSPAAPTPATAPEAAYEVEEPPVAELKHRKLNTIRDEIRAGWGRALRRG